MSDRQREQIAEAALEVLREEARYLHVFAVCVGVSVKLGSLVRRVEVEVALEDLLARALVEREHTSHGTYRWGLAS